MSLLVSLDIGKHVTNKLLGTPVPVADNGPAMWIITWGWSY